VLVFAILERIKLFGDRSTRFNGVIALVIGILLVRQGTLVEFINAYLPNVSAVIVVFLGFLILLGIFGFGSSQMKGGVMILFVLIALGGGIWALTQASDQGDFEIPLIGETISEEDAGSLFVVGIFLLIVGVAMCKPPKKGLEGFIESMGKIGNSLSGAPKG
jgi:hypothetical protein